MFVLATPDGSLGIRYQKSHPVPSVEDVLPGMLFANSPESVPFTARGWRRLCPVFPNRTQWRCPGPCATPVMCHSSPQAERLSRSWIHHTGALAAASATTTPSPGTLHKLAGATWTSTSCCSPATRGAHIRISCIEWTLCGIMIVLYAPSPGQLRLCCPIMTHTLMCRAVEQGFTLFSCTRFGYSGIVTPWNEDLALKLNQDHGRLPSPTIVPGRHVFNSYTALVCSWRNVIVHMHGEQSTPWSRCGFARKCISDHCWPLFLVLALSGDPPKWI
jgi:hypothetical protein